MSIFIIAGSDTLGIFPILVLPSENFTVDIKPPIEIKKHLETEVLVVILHHRFVVDTEIDFLGS